MSRNGLFLHGVRALCCLVPDLIGGLADELVSAGTVPCTKVHQALRLSVFSRDRGMLLETLRVASDVHGLSAEGKSFALGLRTLFDCPAVMLDSVRDWAAWEALRESFDTSPVQIDDGSLRSASLPESVKLVLRNVTASSLISFASTVSPLVRTRFYSTSRPSRKVLGTTRTLVATRCSRPTTELSCV